MTLTSLIEYENRRLKYVRMWIMSALFVNIGTSFTLYFQDKFSTSMWASVLLNLTVIVIAIGLFLSYKRNIKTIYWTLLIYQLRLLQAYINIGNSLVTDNPNEIIFLKTAGLVNILLNQMMIFSLFTKWRNKVSFAFYFLIIFGIFQNTYGFR